MIIQITEEEKPKTLIPDVHYWVLTQKDCENQLRLAWDNEYIFRCAPGTGVSETGTGYTPGNPVCEDIQFLSNYGADNKIGQ